MQGTDALKAEGEQRLVEEARRNPHAFSQLYNVYFPGCTPT